MPPSPEGGPFALRIHNASAPFVELQYRTGRYQVSARSGSPADETPLPVVDRKAAEADQVVLRPSRRSSGERSRITRKRRAERVAAFAPMPMTILPSSSRT
jgi:hypothetical protein